MGDCPNAHNHQHGDTVFVCDGCFAEIGCGWDVLVDDEMDAVPYLKRLGFKCCYDPGRHKVLSAGTQTVTDVTSGSGQLAVGCTHD